MVAAEISRGFQRGKAQLVADRIRHLETHSPLALSRHLLASAEAQGISQEGLGMLFKAGHVVERAFPHEEEPSRQEEVKVYPAVHSYKVAIRLVESGIIPREELGKYATIAVLHDTLEDTKLKRADIASMFGEDVAQGVVLLSKHVDGQNIKDKDYFANLRNAPPEIRWIKVFDRIENLSVLLAMHETPALEDFHLPSGRSIPKSLRHNYEEAIENIVVLATDNPSLAKELDSVLARAKEALTADTTRRVVAA